MYTFIAHCLVWNSNLHRNLASKSWRLKWCVNHYHQTLPEYETTHFQTKLIAETCQIQEKNRLIVKSCCYLACFILQCRCFVADQGGNYQGWEMTWIQRSKGESLSWFGSSLESLIETQQSSCFCWALNKSPHRFKLTLSCFFEATETYFVKLILKFHILKTIRMCPRKLVNKPQWHPIYK